MRTITTRPAYLLPTLAAILALNACATGNEPFVHPGIEWVRTSAEFEALSLQVYADATDDLAEKLADRSWSALPYQQDAADLPPAIIFDVDETVVSNADFQLTLVPPFTDEKLNAWNDANRATPIPGVAAFAAAARALGIEIYFVTNRPCLDDACTQKAVTRQDIVEAGIPVELDRVMLAYERPDWNKGKKNRRDFVAQSHRVLMLFGDDLNDFIPCSRRRAVPPCAEGATQESRAEGVRRYADYWGDGWYMLPNPMHGSWTTVD